VNFRVKWEVESAQGCCVGAYQTAWAACQAAMQAILQIADSESAMRTSLAEVRYSIWEGDQYRGEMPTPEKYNSFYRGER
jgi:hypothetical protein